MKRILFTIAILTLTVFSQKAPLPVPIVTIHICGQDGEGIVIEGGQAQDLIPYLESQGCAIEDIRIVKLDEKWAFIYGTRIEIAK